MAPPVRYFVAMIVLLAACVPPSSSAVTATAAGTPAPSESPLLPGTCEYLGARFSLPAGLTAKETTEPREPLARVTIEGELGRHKILLDIIPRAAAEYGNERTPTALSKRYFDAVRAAPFAKTWTDIREVQYPGIQRTYPALLAVEPFSSLGVAFQNDHIILLVFPDVLDRTGGYFYSFFWTDTHVARDPRGPLTELEKVVDGFTVLTSPVGAASRGCR